MQPTESPNHLSHNSLPAESMISSYFDEQISSHENVDQEPTMGAFLLQPEKMASPNGYSRKRSNTTDASNAPKKPKMATNESARESSLEPDTGSGSEERASDESKNPEIQSGSQTTDAALGGIVREEAEAIVNFRTTGPADPHASQHTEAMPLIPIVSQNVDTEPVNPDHEISANQTAVLEEPSATPSSESASGDTIVNTPVETLPEPGSCTATQSNSSIDSNEIASPHKDAELPVSTGASSEATTSSVGSYTERSLTAQSNDDLNGPDPTEATGVATPSSQGFGSRANPIPLDDHDNRDVSNVIDADAAKNNRRRQMPRKKTDKPSMVDWTSPSHKEQLDREVQNKWNIFLAHAYLVNPHWVRAPIEEAVMSSLNNNGSLPLATARQLIRKIDPIIRRARGDLSSKIKKER